MLEQILLELQVDKQTHLEHEYINRLEFLEYILNLCDADAHNNHDRYGIFLIYETLFPPSVTLAYMLNPNF